ncbi:MAG: hypothetical protein ACYDCI_12535, partial [Candidatus Limnocylindrales bacterium]
MRGPAGGAARPRSGRRLGVVVAVLLALSAAVGAAPGGVPPAAAATPDLSIVAAATYDVRPTRHLVHVTVDLQATNRHADTVIRRYYVDHAVLSVQPGASGFVASAPGSKLHPKAKIAAPS